jgi:thymidylate synthase
MKNPNEMQFLNALAKTRAEGSVRKTRNGITTAILAHQMRFHMADGFPALTTKELVFPSVAAELLWFLDAGKETSYRMSLDKLNQIQGKPQGAKNIWTHDQARFASQGKAKFPGDCGRIYGAQWRNYKVPIQSNDPELWQMGTYDQIAELVNRLKKDPYSRYLIVNAWNPADIDDMCLPPCHMKFQCFVREVGGSMHLDLSMDQRSCDMFLGVPFNIASYALLLHMLAQCVDMVPGELVITLEDCHIYLASISPEGVENYDDGHMKQVEQQLSYEPLDPPRIWLNPEIKDIDGFTMADIRLEGYENKGRLPAKML